MIYIPFGRDLSLEEICAVVKSKVQSWQLFVTLRHTDCIDASVTLVYYLTSLILPECLHLYRVEE